MSSIGKLMSATIATQLVGILTAPLMSRLFTPETSGKAAIFASSVALLSGVACLRYEQAIPLAETEVKRLNLERLCAWLIPLFVFIATLILLAIAPSLSNYLNVSGPSWFWLALPWIAALVALEKVATAGLLRDRHVSTVTKLQVGQSLSQIAFQLSTGFASRGHLACLVAGQALSPCLFLLGYFRVDRREFLSRLRATNLHELRTVAWEFRKFPQFNSWSAIIQTIGQALPIFAMSAIHGAHSAGCVRLAHSLVTLPITALCGAITNIYWAEAARLVRTEPDQLMRFYLRFTGGLLLVGLLLICSTFLLAHYIPVIFGERWADSAGFAKALVFAAAFSLACAPAVNLSVLGFNFVEALWVVLRLLLGGSAVAVAARLNLDQFQTLTAIVIALVAGYCMLISTNVWSIQFFTNRQKQGRMDEQLVRQPD